MRLINVDKLPFTDPQNSDYKCGWNDALWAVKEIPTIDAVPVVRCRDCKYYDMMSRDDVEKVCLYWMSFMSKDEYCSIGERREDVDA